MYININVLCVLQVEVAPACLEAGRGGCSGTCRASASAAGSAGSTL